MTHNTSSQPEDLPGTQESRAEINQGRLGARTPLFEAYNSARYQRQSLIREIQKYTTRPLVCYISGDMGRIDRDDTIHFNDLLYHLSLGQDIELMLHTLGGDPDIVVIQGH